MFLTRYIFVLIVVLLIACEQQVVNEKTMENLQSSSLDEIPELNLSLPIELSEDVGELGHDEEPQTLLPDLFEKRQHKKNVSVSGKPILESEKPIGELPSITGAEVTFEMKTP